MTKKNKPISEENNETEPVRDANDESRVETAPEETGNASSGEPEASGQLEEHPEDLEPKSLEEALNAARDESRQNHERYLRTVADWENYRRRVTREKEELRQYSLSGLVEEFLPVLDNLDLGLQSAANHPEAANVAKGFQMVADQIRAILERNGVKELNPVGEAFDPHHHEAVSNQPHDEIGEGDVVHVVRKGYMLNTRLLRPATVVVSSGAPATQNEA